MNQPEELFVRRLDDLIDLVPVRDDYEATKVSALLRQLLLDEAPLVHLANRERRLALRFRVNRVGGINDVPLNPEILFHGHGLDPSLFELRAGARDLRLEEFLRHPIAETPERQISVADVIRYVANKAGGVHYDKRRAPDESVMELIMAKLAVTGVQSFRVAIEAVARIAATGLRPLRDAIVVPPESIKLFGHYKVPSVGAIAFDGRTQFLESNIRHRFEEGFSWNAVIRIVKQPEPGLRVIYQVGNLSGDPPLLTLSLDSEGGFVAQFDSGHGPPLIARVEQFTASVFFDAWTYLAVDLALSETSAEVAVHANSALVASCQSTQSAERDVTRQTIGADLAGANAASFELRELISATHALTPLERQKLGKYFWLQWHD